MVARFYIENGSILDFEKRDTQLKPFLKNEFVLSEKVWFKHGILPLFDKHIALLKEITAELKLPTIPSVENKNEFLRISKRLVNKNKAFKSGFLEYTFIWGNDKVNTFITCTPQQFQEFPLLEEGVFCAYAERVKYSGSPYISFRFKNEPLWNSLSMLLKGSMFQNAVVTNEENNITECIEANIYFIKGNTLHTPSLSTGCYNNLLRGLIIEAALQLNLEIDENARLGKEFILEADEAFLASEGSGMQKIVGIDKKRFLHNKVKQLNEELNKLLETS